MLLSPLRYPGGKRNLVPRILPLLLRGQSRVPVYIEPFVGGGSVFFALAGQKAFDRAILVDKSPFILAFYESLLTFDPAIMLRRLEHFASESAMEPESAYYGWREAMNRDDCPLGKMGPLFYAVNRCTVNGLMRVNRDGEFNASIGKDNKGRPHRFTVEDIEAWMRIRNGLREADCKAVILQGDGVVEIDLAPAGAVLLVDPPYSGGFVGYTAERWTKIDDVRLYEVCARAHRDRGCRLVITGPDTPWQREVAKVLTGWTIEAVPMRRSINVDGDGRGAVSELLISSP